MLQNEWIQLEFYKNLHFFYKNRTPTGEGDTSSPDLTLLGALAPRPSVPSAPRILRPLLSSKVKSCIRPWAVINALPSSIVLSLTLDHYSSTTLLSENPTFLHQQMTWGNVHSLLNRPYFLHPIVSSTRSVSLFLISSHSKAHVSALI